LVKDWLKPIPNEQSSYWFISVPDNELKTFYDNINEYPVYFVDFKTPEIKLEAKNMKEFLLKWFPKDKLNYLSDKYIKQEIPIITIKDEFN
jgi:hypothetical protein